MCFGDGANVYNYCRIRHFISTFLAYELAIPVWSYFDDSMLVSRRGLCRTIWFAFLKLHVLLGIPIKGNPLSGGSDKDLRKLCPFAGSNKCLGELLDVGQLPITAAPTSERIAKSQPFELDSAWEEVATCNSSLSRLQVTFSRRTPIRPCWLRGTRSFSPEAARRY